MPLEHYPTPKDLEDFWEAGKELDAAYVLLAKSCGLSEPEYWSMVFVADGVATQREICALLSLSRQTINSAFKLLVAKGLIQLEPLEQDQRSKRASLTPKGEQLLAERILPSEAAEADAWLSLTEEERQVLVRATRQFGSALRQIATGREQNGICPSEDL